MTSARMFVVSLGLFGCSIGNQLIAGRGEYDLYRATHLAPTMEERLAAGNRYLRSDPEGRYAPEIKTWFEPAEKAYVGAAWNSLPRLRAYKTKLPDGPSIERVKARAEELEATIGFADKREQESAARLAAIQASLERAATQRQAFLDEVSGWVRVLSAIPAWNKPLAELSPDVVAGFGGDKAADSCLEELCSKASTPRFAIPVKEKLVPREASYSVELVLKGGLVVEARVRGRELFSRIGEALDRRAVSFADPQSRAEGIGRALGLVTNALGNAFAADGCERPAVSPIVLERACGGSRVIATAALTTGEDDVLVFAPEAPPEPPKAPSGKGTKSAPKTPKPPTPSAPQPKPPGATTTP
ncbi:MAG TPA: hypothetical protein VMS65_15990 [Polyangiaceae bacterium]|nr:hypothetical protein [Polyangiaceae bacterium]